MSIDGTQLFFEGFLQKRKDTIKIRWVTYWFRLHNTTLFFYTKKNGSASNLRGNYYIYTVQTVREVHRSGGKRFMFEIIMTNGKRKMLAADTAALRQEWVGHLWQAMHLSGSGVSDLGNTDVGVSEQLRKTNSCGVSNSCYDSESLPVRPFTLHTTLHTSSEELRYHEDFTSVKNHEEAAYQNKSSDFSCQNHNDEPQWPSEPCEPQGLGDYDVLPLRKEFYVSNSPESEEGLYDFPLSYRKPDDTEGIYDVPSNLRRPLSAHTAAVSSEDDLGDCVGPEGLCVEESIYEDCE
ncbi:uncharacterized protein V6R79_015071 [Siganus canaliculatus]